MSKYEEARIVELYESRLVELATELMAAEADDDRDGMRNIVDEMRVCDAALRALEEGCF